MYFYIVSTLLIEIVNNLEEADILIQDMIDAFGTIMCMAVVLYCLFIKKFLDIYSGNLFDRTLSSLLFRKTSKRSVRGGGSKSNVLKDSKNNLYNNGSRENLGSRENIGNIRNYSKSSFRDFRNNNSSRDFRNNNSSRDLRNNNSSRDLINNNRNIYLRN